MRTTSAGRIIAPRSPITGRREATYALPSYVRENLYVLETLIEAELIVASVAL